MLIEKAPTKTIPLKDMHHGDVIEYKDSFYIVTDIITPSHYFYNHSKHLISVAYITIVGLRTGTSHQINQNTFVTPIRGKFVVEN